MDAGPHSLKGSAQYGLLERSRLGQPGAAESLFAAVYGQLHRIATRYMRAERVNHTLQPTALVNEAYARLFADGAVNWKDQAHLVRSAARAMRQVLVDYARRKNRLRRGGNWQKISFDSSAIFVCIDQPSILMALDEALQRLEALDPQAAAVVELLYFSGLSQPETARALGISARTVSREWRLARNWLHDEVSRAMTP